MKKLIIESRMQQEVINLLKQTIPVPDRILELGSGFGNYTILLRSAFERSYILGWDKKKLAFSGNQHESPAIEHLSESRYGDIHHIEYVQDYASFDMVTLGTVLKPLWNHFSLYELSDYQQLLEMLNRYLKPGGHFLITLLLNDYSTPQDSNVSDFYKYLASLSEVYGEIGLNDKITELTSEIFNNMGYQEIQIKTIHEEHNVRFWDVDCNKLMHIYKKDSELHRKTAGELHERIQKHGISSKKRIGIITGKKRKEVK